MRQASGNRAPTQRFIWKSKVRLPYRPSAVLQHRRMKPTSAAATTWLGRALAVIRAGNRAGQGARHGHGRRIRAAICGFDGGRRRWALMLKLYDLTSLQQQREPLGLDEAQPRFGWTNYHKCAAQPDLRRNAAQRQKPSGADAGERLVQGQARLYAAAQPLRRHHRRTAARQTV